MPDIEQFVELGGIVVVVAAFLWYLVKRDKNFGEILKNHLTHNSNALTDVKVALKEICTFLKTKNGNK